MICSYLNQKFSLNEDYYKHYFGPNIPNETSLVQILKLVVLSDYYRLNYSNKDVDNFIHKKDFEYLKLIQNSNISRLLLEFELDEEFSNTVVKDFLLYNSNVYDPTKDNIDDQKTLKKIDPFYHLNKYKNS